MSDKLNGENIIIQAIISFKNVVKSIKSTLIHVPPKAGLSHYARQILTDSF